MPIFKKSVALQKKDLIAVLNINYHVQNCSTLDDLKSFLHSKILPILDTQSHFFCWSDPHLFSRIESNTSYFSETSCYDLEKQITCCRVSEKICLEGCPFKEIEMNDSCKNLSGPMAKVLRKNLSQLPKDHPCWECLHTALNKLDQSESTSGIGFMRLIPRDKFWTLRDKGILDLVWPHFLQAIRTAFHKKSFVKLNASSIDDNDDSDGLEFNAEERELIHDLNKYQILINTLVGQQAAFAIIGTNNKIYFQNDKFVKIFSQEINGKPWKKLLNKLGGVGRDLNGILKNLTSRPDYCHTSFIQSGQEVFELMISSIKLSEDRDELLLVQLKPNTKYYSQLNSYITGIGLTKREKEISLMVKQGLSDDDISSQLYISPYTVRNHLRSVYQKLNVNRRSQMIAILNQ